MSAVAGRGSGKDAVTHTEAHGRMREARVRRRVRREIGHGPIGHLALHTLGHGETHCERPLHGGNHRASRLPGGWAGRRTELADGGSRKSALNTSVSSLHTSNMDPYDNRVVAPF